MSSEEGDNQKTLCVESFEKGTTTGASYGNAINDEQRIQHHCLAVAPLGACAKDRGNLIGYQIGRIKKTIKSLM